VKVLKPSDGTSIQYAVLALLASFSIAIRHT